MALVAHDTAHLEAVLAGAPEETIEVTEAPHLVGLQNYYTEQGVLARRGRALAELADEIEAAVAARYAELQANPPVDPAAPAPRTPARWRRRSWRTSPDPNGIAFGRTGSTSLRKALRSARQGTQHD